MTPPDPSGPAMVETAQDVVDAAHTAVERLRRAWGWLAVLTEPGRGATTTGRVLTDAQRARLADLVAAEAAERAQHARDGLSALPAMAAPVRVGLLDVQRLVGRIVDAEVCDRIDRARGARHIGAGGALPARVAAALVWLSPPERRPVWVVNGAGEVWRGLHRPGALDDLDGLGVARLVRRHLDRAARIAREAVGIVGERVVPLAGVRCPACGLRTLQVDATARDERGWSVACISEACLCTGSGCGCRQRVRYRGRRHAWAYGDLSGPFGLWSAAARARRPVPVRAGVRGHGGWSSRAGTG